MFTPDCVLYYITKLINIKVENIFKPELEQSIECLCNLLKTVGMELEQVNFYGFYSMF